MYDTRLFCKYIFKVQSQWKVNPREPPYFFNTLVKHQLSNSCYELFRSSHSPVYRFARRLSFGVAVSASSKKAGKPVLPGGSSRSRQSALFLERGICRTASDNYQQGNVGCSQLVDQPLPFIIIILQVAQGTRHRSGLRSGNHVLTQYILANVVYTC